MRTFLAIAMAMSLVRKPEEKLYWTKKHSVHTPFFAKVMSHRRYATIKKFLHFSNDTCDPVARSQPRLDEIWPVHSHLNEKFREAYVPQRLVTIDERCEGAPMKRAGFGMKCWFLREAKSGYICSTLLHAGKGAIIVDPQYATSAKSTQVVMSLMEPLLNKGYCVAIGDFHSSVELAHLLASHATDTYGIVKYTRMANPAGLAMPKAGPGFLAAYRKGKIMVMRWKDKRDVCFISTVHGVHSVRKKPKIAADCKFTMRDRASYHHVARKTGKKYHKKVFFHLMEQALWNAYVLFAKQIGRVTDLEFRLRLIDEYVEAYHDPECSSKNARPGKSPNPLRLTERHFLAPIPSTGKKSAPTKRCAVCCSKRSETGKRIRRESRYHCRDCNVGLCLTPCFETYHTELNF